MSNEMEEAILHNNQSALSHLVRDANINSPDANGYTPLYFSCMKSSVEQSTIETLIKMGAAVDARGTDNETPLYIAVFNNRASVVDLLIRHGADIRAVNGPTKETVLHLAARLGNAEMVSRLVEKKADLNARNAKQETPLYAAAKAGQHTTVYLLLTAGANAALPNEDGKSPLFIASERGFKNVVLVLKADQKDWKHAKAAADLEQREQLARVMSSSEILARAQRDEQFSEMIRRRGSLQTQLREDGPMEVTEIKVPKPATRTHDPLTGAANGPCRSLEEVGYDKPPAIPRELQNRPPARLPRTGGTTMVVGTGTTDGPKEPARVDTSGDERLSFHPPKATK